MNRFAIGTILKVDGLQGKVIGHIVYSNPNDGNKKWIEYRLTTNEGERWLTIDDAYEEYSISRPSELKGSAVGYEWKKVDEGIQVVDSYSGSVDVDKGERADFVEHEDETGEKILSIEMWEDGTEVSEGYYVDKEEIVLVSKPSKKYNKKKHKKRKRITGEDIIAYLAISFMIFGWFFFTFSDFDTVKISKYLKSNTSKYEYVTSITGNKKQKADVYKIVKGYDDIIKQDNTVVESGVNPKIDFIVKDIIDGTNGNTEVVTPNKENGDDSVSILTNKEYCIVYFPEDDQGTAHIQVSDRKFNYTSDIRPYHASALTHAWYRNHYYNSGYSKDSSKWKNIPSSYKMHKGPIVKDLGNGYYDVYSSSVKQSSINSRNSSSGGVSSGK